MPPGTYRDPKTGKVKARPAPAPPKPTRRKVVRVAPGLPAPSAPAGTPQPPNTFAPPPPKPKKTDWRLAPGGGYVEQHSGRTVPIARGPQEDKARTIVRDPRYSQQDRRAARRYLAAYEAARRQQERWFKEQKAFEAEAAARVPPSMRAQWDAEAQAAFNANPAKYGLPGPEPRHWWQTPGEQHLERIARGAAPIAKAVGKGLADWEKRIWYDIPMGLAQGKPGLFLHEPEHELRTAGGKALSNALFHGDFSHPAAIALEAAMLPIPLKGTPMVSTALVRLGAGILAARTAELGGTDALALAARAVNMTAKERKALRLVPFEANATPTLNGPGREGWVKTLEARIGAKAAKPYIALADARARAVHAQMTKTIADNIAVLDAKVADGTATVQDIELRKELGMMKAYGVPEDWYWTHLDQSGSGIPDWIQAKYAERYPNAKLSFKFEGPQRAGKNFSGEAIARRLAAKLKVDPASLPQNAAIRRKGLQVLGYTSFDQWLKRVKAVMPGIEERTYWANWYRTFEPLFRKAFGEDADAIMRGFAASQANASPSDGLTAVLKIMDRIRLGKPLTKNEYSAVGLSIQDAIKGTPLESGMQAKLSDFTDALAQLDTRTWMGHDLAGGAPAPSDIWAARDLGYIDRKLVNRLEQRFGLKEGVHFKVDSPGAPTGGRYERIAEQYNQFADKLNAMEGGKGFDGHQWTPADVQALGWGSIQKFVGVDPEDIIQAFDKKAFDVATEVTKGVTGLGANLTIEQAQHVAQLFEPDIRRLIEDTPGIYLMPEEEPFKFTTGGWAGGQNGSVQFKVLGTQENVQAFLTRLAKAFDQEYVQAVRRTSSASANPRGAIVFHSPAFADERAKQRFFEAVAEHAPSSKNPATGKVEKELQGYARAAPDASGNEGITIRTHKPTATGKGVAPWLARYDKAVKAAEKKTGIKVNVSHENLQMLVGDQHGSVEPSATVPGASRARGVGDRLAAGIRAKLERAVGGIESAGAAPGADGANLSAALRPEDVKTFQLHGVHAQNTLPVANHGLGAGQSGIFLGQGTPMPLRIASHEEGHYIDTHILPKYPKAKKVIEDLLAGQDAVTRAETFARWAEEYALTGGGANLPAELKPAMREVANHVLEETANYPGRAAERIWLPPEVADVFDTIHGWEGLTGGTWVSGKDTFDSGIQALAKAEIDYGDTESAWKATRFLRLNDKTVYLPRAHSRITQNAIEKVADKISNWLMYDNAATKATNFIMRTARTEMRVPRKAARDLAEEARRSVNRMHSAVVALPKEGSTEDTAHFWWAQLPRDQRNLGGLSSVRDRMQSELNKITSGEYQQGLQAELDRVNAELKAYTENDYPRDLMREHGNLTTLIEDLPQRTDDLRRAISKMDATIAAKPTYDQKIVDAMSRLSTDREKLLIEAGLLDPQRAANRRGLLAQWLGHQSDGGEVYVGHRMKGRSGKENTLPSSFGTGKPKTPEGLSNANRLALVSAGRARMSTHVAQEDWAAAQIYKETLGFRKDLGLMGKPYTGRIREDQYLVNVEGKFVPKSWKNDPFANIAEESEGTLEDRLKELRDAVIADGGNGAHVEALAKAAAENKRLSSLRVIDKDVADRYFKTIGKVRGVTKGGRAYDNMVNLMSASLIFMRMGYIPKNLTQNLIMAVPHEGAFFLVNAPRAAQLAKHAELRHLAVGEIGGGATAALNREISGFGRIARGTHAIAGFVTRFADDPIRLSAFIHELARHGVIPKYTPYLRDEDFAAIEHVLTDTSEKGRALLNNVMQVSRDAMGDFNRMTPGQRHWARRFLIIPGWLMAGSRYPVHFALTHPLRSAALAYVAAGEPYADRLGLPQNPSLGDYYKRSGFNEGFQIGNRFLRTTSLSPVNTPYDIVRSFLGRGSEDPATYANPWIPLLWHTANRESAHGQHAGLGAAAWSNAQGILPNISFVRGMISPKDTGNYPGDRTRLGRLERELGVVPIEIVAHGTSAKKVADKYQKAIEQVQSLGIPVSPELQRVVQSRADWESMKPPAGSSQGEKLQAKYKLLLKYHPEAKQYKAQIDAAAKNEALAKRISSEIDQMLGWSNLSELTHLVNQEKKAGRLK